jgi:methanethiol S-methyltransferase
MVVTEPSPVRARPTLGSVLALGYGLACYAAFVAVFAYAVAFLADVVVPRTVDHGGPATGSLQAAAIDVLLFAVFAVQHTVMARPGFKRRWTRVVPRHVERSTYVLAATGALALVLWQWRPIPPVLWDVSAPAVRGLVWVVYAAGWLWALAMSCAIDHLDLFGLRQVSRHLRSVAALEPTFAVPLPYRLVRHPMMVGFIVAFVAAPTMTVGHLLFAALGFGYILVGVRREERDLSASLPGYDAYARTTPRLMPRLSVIIGARTADSDR